MEHIKNILFIDIETVPVTSDYELLSEVMQAEWIRKSKYLKTGNEITTDSASLFTEKAGVYSEFAQVVCIGIGSLVQQDEIWKLRLKAITNDNEKILLNSFSDILTRFEGHYPHFRFCGHNIREFDIPFLCRRMIINGLALHKSLQLNGKKSWEVQHLEDTLELWKFGDYKHYTSLALLAEVLGIPSPKDDMDGSMVGDVYWKQKDLERIGKYCLKDVLTTAKVYLKLKGIEINIQAD
jgi:uncharacterized protein YprB with RNaseH-like and TPR domain